MTEQIPEQQTPPTPAGPPLPPGDGAAPAAPAPVVADSPSLEPATTDGPDAVAAGDLVTWTETDAEGYEHPRTGLVTEVLELPGEDDGAPVLHARIAELPEPRLLPTERLHQL